MTPTFSAESQTQPREDNAKRITTKRIAAIVLSPDKKNVLLLKNLDPYIDMFAYPNRNLHWKPNTTDTVKDLLYKRTGFKEINTIKNLKGNIFRKFRKTKKEEPNENAHYQDSIYVIHLASKEKDKIKDSSHKIYRKPISEISYLFKSDGSNGSSFMIRKMYCWYYR